MGNLLRVLNDRGGAAGSIPKVDFFVDFERAEPTESELELYQKVEGVLSKAPAFLSELKEYKGAGEQIREAISNPTSAQHQEVAWQTVGPLVQQLRSYYEYAQNLETILIELLSALCSPEMDAVTHLEKQQAITKQLAHLLDFTLSFDDLKMNNPAIQNDFSYYRRTLNRRKMEDVSQNVGEEEVPDDIANRMSLFYANPTPMLNVLTAAMSRLVVEKTSPVTLENATECLCTMASVCRVVCENAVYYTRFKNQDTTTTFCLRVMVGVIILYDHLHPVGAFAKKAAIDIKGSVKVIKDRAPGADGLINALKYNTKHFNDEATPKRTKEMLS